MFWGFVDGGSTNFKRTPSKQLLKIDTQKKTFLAVLLIFPTIQTENELTILYYTLTKL